MAGKRRQGEIINLDERRRRRHEEHLAEANRRMIEAEHALFVALRLAGHRGEHPGKSGSMKDGQAANTGNVGGLAPNRNKRRAVPTIVPLSRVRTRRKKAA